MSALPGIVVTGASGRMGQMLAKTVLASDKARLVGAVERDGHDWVGKDLGVAMGGVANGVIVTDDPLEAFAKAQAILDFTAPAATVKFAAIAAQARAVHVIGTTGMSGDEIAALAPAARHAIIVRAGNMSLGVNLLTKLTRMVSAALDEDFDIEVIESHHSMKVDAPSGTALMLGEHDVLFAGAGERIVLRHVASDRSLFAKGALKAALWGQDQKPGEYDMLDVLGLNEGQKATAMPFFSQSP